MEIVEENRHIAVNMEELLASYESQVNMDDLTRAVKPCIFEIPPTLYRHNKTAYLPNAFSFGPIHYLKPHLQATQVIKLRLLQDMFHVRHGRTELTAVERAVHERLVEVRQCYAKQVEVMDDDERFVKILVLDGCFIIRLFLQHDDQKKFPRLLEPDLWMRKTKIDTAYLLQCLYHDLILLENQIPWFVLELLCDLLYGSDRKLKLRGAAIRFFSNMFSHDGLPIPETLLEKERIEHILDLLRKSLFLSFLEDEKKKQPLDLLLNMLPYQLLPFWKNLLWPLWQYLLLPPWKYLLLPLLKHLRVPLLVLGQLLYWLLECLCSLTLRPLKFLQKLLRAPKARKLERRRVLLQKVEKLEMLQQELEMQGVPLRELEMQEMQQQPELEKQQRELEMRREVQKMGQRELEMQGVPLRELEMQEMQEMQQRPELEKQQRELEMRPEELEMRRRALVIEVRQLNMPVPELEMQAPDLEMQVPSASRLREAGVQFKRGRLRLNIKFQKGVLEVPSLLIHDTTETIFRNLIAFEQCNRDCPPIVTSYAKLMDNLIDTIEDIDILCKNGIICNSLNPEDATKFFNSLCNSTYISRNPYADIYREVNRYCQRWWPRWRAFYIHNYFGKPWAIFSQIFALIILALTILQVIHK